MLKQEEQNRMQWSNCVQRELMETAREEISKWFVALKIILKAKRK